VGSSKMIATGSIIGIEDKGSRRQCDCLVQAVCTNNVCASRCDNRDATKTNDVVKSVE
jgi:hypothetical protein